MKSKFIPPGRSIQITNIGESFVSDYAAKNVAAEFYRSGAKGTTKKAYLIDADTGESRTVTVGTITEISPDSNRKSGFQDRVKRDMITNQMAKAMRATVAWLEDVQHTGKGLTVSGQESLRQLSEVLNRYEAKKKRV